MNSLPRQSTRKYGARCDWRDGPAIPSSHFKLARFTSLYPIGLILIGLPRSGRSCPFSSLVDAIGTPCRCWATMYAGNILPALHRKPYKIHRRIPPRS